MARVFGSGPAEVRPNMTPMVDVVFLLIVFFVLVAQITSAERLRMALPEVEPGQSVDAPRDKRMIVNVLPLDDGAGVRVGTRSFDETDDGLADLSEAIAIALARDENLRVLVRAPRWASYERVHRIMKACAAGGSPALDLIVQPIEGGADG